MFMRENTKDASWLNEFNSKHKQKTIKSDLVEEDNENSDSDENNDEKMEEENKNSSDINTTIDNKNNTNNEPTNESIESLEDILKMTDLLLNDELENGEKMNLANCSEMKENELNNIENKEINQSDHGIDIEEPKELEGEEETSKYINQLSKSIDDSNLVADEFCVDRVENNGKLEGRILIITKETFKEADSSGNWILQIESRDILKYIDIYDDLDNENSRLSVIPYPKVKIFFRVVGQTTPYSVIYQFGSIKDADSFRKILDPFISTQQRTVICMHCNFIFDDTDIITTVSNYNHFFFFTI